MEIADAVDLIQPGFNRKAYSETWADLGCGSGTFTNALASLLRKSSKIYAVDKQTQSILSIGIDNALIEFIKLNFIYDPLPFLSLDGILMANSMHFVLDKSALIYKLKNCLKPNGKWIIVEYDTEKSNQWVPYPLSYDQLVTTFSSCGFNRIEKIGQRNSAYRTDKIYACLVESIS